MKDKSQILTTLFESIEEAKEIVLTALTVEIETDIKHFSEVVRKYKKGEKMREYCRGRIEEARFILARLKEL